MTPPAASRSFTLVEILAATAVLSILFTIMFSILQQTSKGWQAANRRVEASQVARLALDQIAYDFENCMAVAAINLAAPGQVPGVGARYAFGFCHADWNQDPLRLATESLAAPGVIRSPGNDYIFLVTTYPSSMAAGTGDLVEVGYIPVYIARTGGYGNVFEGRYVLLRHSPIVFTGGTITTGSARPTNDFLQNPDWALTPRLRDNEEPRNFFPMIDNLISFDVEFLYIDSLGNLTNSPTWGRPTNGTTRWNNPGGARDGLPLAADITLAVLDEKAAVRILKLRGLANGLTQREIQEMAKPTPNWSAITDNAVRATLQESVLTLKRRVFFKNAQR